MADRSAVPLGPRGGRLWAALRDARPLNAAEIVTLEELCRIADRLDRLDALLRGDVETWARLEQPHNGARSLVVVLDDALAESRQLAATFQRLAASLKLPDAHLEIKDGISELAARRDARRAAR